jgi:hypothetical protein
MRWRSGNRKDCRNFPAGALTGAADGTQIGADFRTLHPRGGRAAIADAHLVTLFQLLAQHQTLSTAPTLAGSTVSVRLGRWVET